MTLLLSQHLSTGIVDMGQKVYLHRDIQCAFICPHNLWLLWLSAVWAYSLLATSYWRCNTTISNEVWRTLLDFLPSCNIKYSFLYTETSVLSENILFSEHIFSATIKHILSQQEEKCLADTLIIFPSFCPFFILYFLPSPPLILLSIILSFLSSKITSCTGFPHSSPEMTIVREIVFIFFSLEKSWFFCIYKDIFPIDRAPEGAVLSIQNLKIVVPPPSVPCGFWWEGHCFSNCFYPTGKVLFLSAVFNIFLCVLVF